MVKYILIGRAERFMKIIIIIICSFFIIGIVLGARTFTKEGEKEVPEEETVIQGNVPAEENQGFEEKQNEIKEEIPNEQIQEEPAEETEEESEKLEKEKPEKDLIIKPSITGSGEYKTF